MGSLDDDSKLEPRMTVKGKRGRAGGRAGGGGGVGKRVSMVRCLTTVVVVVFGGEGVLRGVAKKSVVRERVGGGAGFSSGRMGDGGRVEKGEAKKAFVLEVEEESEMEDGIMSENVDDNDDALESDDTDRENGAAFSVVAVIIVAQQIHISSCHK